MVNTLAKYFTLRLDSILTTFWIFSIPIPLGIGIEKILRFNYSKNYVLPMYWLLTFGTKGNSRPLFYCPEGSQFRLIISTFLIFPLLLFSPEKSKAQIKTETNHELRSAIEELNEYIALPNDAINTSDIAKNINWTEKAFEKRGFKTTQLEGNYLPILLAEQSFSDEAPTVMFYFHLDGQPARAEEWDQKDPFQTVLKKQDDQGKYVELPWESLNNGIDDEWRVFGRSVSDDKGPIVMFLNAMDILLSDKKSPAFNLKVVIDTEEEKGSSGLKELLNTQKEKFKADFLVVMDGPMHSSNLPTLTLGCRGSAGVTLTTYGPRTPQHSGHFGNYSPNPAFLLAQIIASMKDDEGRVTIPGFYDGISFDEESLKIMADVPDNKKEINDRLGIAEEEKVGRNYQESLQYPSLNIRGMSSAIVGRGGGTIIPAEAVAAFDIRLVPETEGSRMVALVKDHIEHLGYRVLDAPPTEEERLTYSRLVYMQGRAGTPAFRTEIDAPISKWLRLCLTENFLEEPVIIRIMGGTVPVVSFIQALEIPTVIVPLVNQDNNQHSPNENLRLGNLKYGIQACLAILSTPIH